MMQQRPQPSQSDSHAPAVSSARDLVCQKGGFLRVGSLMGRRLALPQAPSKGRELDAHISWRSGSPLPHKGCRPGTCCRDPLPWPLNDSPTPYPDRPPDKRACPSAIRRSEEHTSELQSLMRISYAALCLKKQK